MQPQTVVDGFNENPKNAEAWTWVYNTYFPEILNSVRKTTGGSPFSEDITEDAFEILLEEEGPFETEPGILQFLKIVAVRQSLNHKREQGTAEKHAEDVKTYYLNLEDQNLANKEADDHCNRIIYEESKKLPRQTGYVFDLAFIYRMSNEQIAQKLCISKRTVETHKSNAYKFLRIEVKKSGKYYSFTLFVIL